MSKNRLIFFTFLACNILHVYRRHRLQNPIGLDCNEVDSCLTNDTQKRKRKRKKIKFEKKEVKFTHIKIAQINTSFKTPSLSASGSHESPIPSLSASSCPEFGMKIQLSAAQRILLLLQFNA